MSAIAARPISYRLVLGVLAVFLVALALPGAAAAAPPDNAIQLRFEGCDLKTTTALPQQSGPDAGKFVCNDIENGADAEYGTGNLGKSWGELDLVPFRLTTDRRRNTGTHTYTLAVALDHEKSDGTPGYDVLTAPVLNTRLSSASGCTIVSVGNEQTTTGIGGTHESIYRLITITQAENTSCVIDFTGRLALGSHGNPGASLQGYLLNESLGEQGVGQRRLPILVKDIAAQSLAKTMSANRGSAYDWTVNKATSPTSLHYGNTCGATASDLSKQVAVTVTWTRTAPSANGKVMLTTQITATNPSHRAITVDVTDEIFAGSTPSGTSLHTKSTDPGGVVVPANTADHPVLLHSTEVDPGAETHFSDRAVATYTDTVTNVAIPGQTEATASAPVVVDTTNPLNGTAQVVETEDISGTGLTVSTDSVVPIDGVAGAFDPAYTLGTPTAGPVTWKTTVSNSGYAVFNKTVTLASAQDTTGSLDDTATAIYGLTPYPSDTKQIPISAERDCATINVTKETVPAATAGSFAFSRDVDRHGGALTSGFSLGHGQTETITDVVPNDGGTAYTVGEDLAATGQPSGFELTDLDCFTTDGTTPDPDSLQTIAPGGANGTADIHVAANETVSCRFENTKQAPPPPVDATVEIEKVVAGAGADAALPFSFDASDAIDGGAVLGLSDNDGARSYTVEPNTTTGYTVEELAGAAGSEQADYDLTDVDCFDPATPGTPDADSTVSGRTATVKVGPGETVRCRFENTKKQAPPPPPDATIEFVKNQVGGDHNAQNQGTEPFPFRLTGTDFGTPAQQAPAGFPWREADGVFSDAVSPAAGGTTYRIDELDSGSDFHLWQISCVDPDPSTPNSSAFRAVTSATPAKQGNAQLTVAPGDQVRCTFTNVKEVEIQFRKDQVGGPENASGQGTDPFRFRLEHFGENAERAAGGFDLRESDGLQTREDEVGPNGESYAIDELAAGPDYELTAITCIDPDTGRPSPHVTSTSITPAGDAGRVEFDLGPGDDIRCTFRNERKPDPQPEPQPRPQPEPVIQRAPEPQPEPIVTVAPSTAAVVEPAPQVLPSRRVAGRARLRGPSGCVSRTFRVRVNGQSIRRVRFFLGSKRLKTVRAAQDGQVLTLKVDPRKLRSGKVHRITAVVDFTTASGTRTKRIRVAFQRCRQATLPRFTG